MSQVFNQFFFQFNKIWGGLAALFFLIFIVLTFFAFSKADVETGVYRILVKTGSSTGHGSGFKVGEPGIIVTNHHVVAGADKISVVYSDGKRSKTAPAKLLWINSDKDLAIIQTLEDIPGAVVELASINGDTLAKSDDVIAVGYPAIADRLAIEIEQGLLDRDGIDKIFLEATHSSGTIQRLVPTLQRLLIQHSANINGGNSGGPLIDSCHRVIGVNSMGASTSLDLNDIKRALLNDTRLKVENPGDLEFAVHVSEVIKGLREKGLSHSVTPGSCWGSIDLYEQIGLGFTLLAALSSLAVFYFTLNRGGNLAFDDFGFSRIKRNNDKTILSPNIDVGVKKYNPTLKDIKTGETFGLLGYTDSDIDHVVGRTAGKADVAINDSSISRSHARIYQNGDSIFVQDLGSTNGTFINDKKLDLGDVGELKNGDILRLGNIKLAFNSGSNQSAQQNVANSNFDHWLLSGFDQAGNTIQHTLNGGPPALKDGELNVICKIGRSNACDFVINDDSVSREHAAIGIDSMGRLSVIDLGSSNGTYVDSIRVSSVPIPMRRSQKLVIGSTEMYISK